MPKPYKPSAGDRNEKSGGDQEMENRKYEASAPDFIPGANYDKEFETYRDTDRKGRSFTSQRRKPGFSPSRNDTDLAAQSVVDHNMTGRKPKQRGGGPGQRPGINMHNNLRYAKGGSVSSRADGVAVKGKTKGRFV
jgi:hypothetical protein